MGIENLPLIDMTHEEASQETILDLNELLRELEPWEREVAEAEIQDLFMKIAGGENSEV